MGARLHGLIILILKFTKNGDFWCCYDTWMVAMETNHLIAISHQSPIGLYRYFWHLTHILGGDVNQTEEKMAYYIEMKVQK